VEQSKFSYIASVDKNNVTPWKLHWGLLTKLNISLIKIQQFYSDFNPRKLKTYVHKNICTRMFVATLFIISKTENNSNVHQ
jgi:hypothetical protein